MSITVKIDSKKLIPIREADERLMSYCVEMTEVTGGTFWKPYTPEQIAGTEEFPPIKDFMSGLADMLEVYPPINLYDAKLRTLAKALGPAWVRVSGSWATGTYYDFDNHTNGVIPEGYRTVLTKEQWTGVLDFVKECDAKLLVSVANCTGTHAATGKWEPDQLKLLFDYSIAYGVPIDAIEFMNEPNTLSMSGAPQGYTREEYCRDQDACNKYVREHYPDVLIVGPCGTGDKPEGMLQISGLTMVSTESIMQGCKEPLDVFSYHIYGGISERGAAMGGHWPAEAATTDAYLAAVEKSFNVYAPIRDRYMPNAPMWVTESADAGCGGNTWASTYLDVIRMANELGRFAQLTKGVVFHNTLASSDYGFLEHGTFNPRPNYWFVLLWNRLMGTTVFDTQEPIREGAHVYAHSRRDGKDGFVYLLINNSTTETTRVELPKCADRYTLSAETLRNKDMMLNGTVLRMENLSMPEMNPVMQEAGELILEPETVTFLVF